MATLGLVSCTKSKEPHACRAEEMYMPSALFRKAWQYAGEHYGSRAILSAKYGLLLADGVIAPYDESLRGATAAQRFAWAKMVLDQMRRRLDMSEIRDVYFHCPKAYSYPLAAFLEELGMQVHLPMKGLRQGEQLGWYGRQGAPSAAPPAVKKAAPTRPPQPGSPMTNRQRVCQYFTEVRPGGATISDIERVTGVAPYQQVYQIVQRLVDEGFLRFERRGRGRGGGRVFSLSETLPPAAAPKAAVPSGRPPPGQGRRGPTEATAAQRERVAGSLLAYGEELAAKEQSGIVEFTQDRAANRLILEDPLAFVLGVVCAQGVKAQTTWALPHLLKARLGHLDPDRIGQMSKQELAAVLARPSALHRFPNKMADYVSAACEKIVKAYAGDASRIWIECSSSSEIARRFDEFRGIDQKKSSMAVNFLFRDLGVQVADPENIDVSYDVHVRRVFLRSGVVDRDSQEEVVAAGRELHPEYPGALDLPAWYTGRNWCHPASPDCGGCPLSSACPERVDLDVEAF